MKTPGTPASDTSSENPAHLSDRSGAVTLETPKMRLVLSPFGARLCALWWRDDSAKTDDGWVNLVVSLADDHAYARQDSYIGAVCGRYANRIAQSRFAGPDGRAVHLSANEGETHLHGGKDGFDRRYWQIPAQDNTANSRTFTLHSPDGDQGYRGNMDVTARYYLAGENRFGLELLARCDQPGPVNLTSHSYWNLGGRMDRSAADHELQIDADHYLPVDAQLIPQGAPKAVSGNGYDFTRPCVIAHNLPAADQGFDHNFCLNGQRGILRPIATLRDPQSGRQLKLSSSEAGLQFYLARHFTGSMKTPQDVPLHANAGIALEPQTWPDSPNRPDFPTPWLMPGETYRHVIEWEITQP